MIILTLEGSGTTVTAGDDGFDVLAAHGARRCYEGDAFSYAIRAYDPDKGLGEVLKIGDWRDDPRWNECWKDEYWTEDE